MINVTLVRHGHARHSLDAGLYDDYRVLSADGRAAVRRSGARLVDEGVTPTVVWASPLTRALQTAELLLRALDSAVEVDVLACLEPGGDLGELLERLSELPHGSEVLLASHEPLCSRLGSIFTGQAINGVGTADVLRMKLSKAEPGGATLVWRWFSAAERLLRAD